VEILDDLGGSGDTLVKDFFTQYIEKGNEHNGDQTDAGDVRYIFEYLYDHAVRFFKQCTRLTGQWYSSFTL
jgi:hypothetical protein